MKNQEKINYVKFIAENLVIPTTIQLPKISKSGERSYSNISSKLKDFSIEITDILTRSFIVKIKVYKYKFEFRYYINTGISPDHYLFSFNSLLSKKITDFLISKNEIDYINKISNKQDIWRFLENN